MKDLVLLHGALGHTQQFTPLLPWLEQHFKVHYFLFKGHGETALPQNGIQMQSYVDQLHQYCEANNLQQFDVFGYSMGGYVALAYTLQQPDRIGNLLTLATKLHWTAEGAAKESKMLNPDVITEKVPKYAAQLAIQHGSEQWKTLLPAIGGMMTELGNNPLLGIHNYPAITGRVQLMVGDKDAMVSLEETLEAARHIPEARFAVLPQTKHPLEQVRPQLLLDLIKDFWGL